jgi:hypothetical protein
MSTINVGSVLPANVFQSRWGYHPVSKEVDKKLRYLNMVYQKTLSLAAAWRRWYRKQPENRIFRPRIKDETGFVVGLGDPVPWKEPEICPIFSYKETGLTWDKKEYMAVEIDKPDILYAARQARTPCLTPEDVRPLPMTVQTINDLYDKAKAWMESR